MLFRSPECLRGLKRIPGETRQTQRGQHVLRRRASEATGKEGEQPHPSLSPTFLPAGLIFYDTKVTVMNRVLNATAQRTADHAAPEITLDPLEIVGGKVSCTEQKIQHSCDRTKDLVDLHRKEASRGAWVAQSVKRPTSARSRSRSPWVRAPRQALG